MVETMILSIEMTHKKVFNLSKSQSDLFAYSIGIIIASLFLIFFIKKISKGLDI